MHIFTAAVPEKALLLLCHQTYNERGIFPTVPKLPIEDSGPRATSHWNAPTFSSTPRSRTTTSTTSSTSSTSGCLPVAALPPKAIGCIILVGAFPTLGFQSTHRDELPGHSIDASDALHTRRSTWSSQRPVQTATLGHISLQAQVKQGKCQMLDRSDRGRTRHGRGRQSSCSLAGIQGLHERGVRRALKERC